MRLLKPKIYVILFCFLILMFLSNDFGIIDIEKTAIVTAVAIDLEDNGDYLASVQISVPEATDSNNEDKKTLLSGKGSTIGGAIKDIGNISGWFPKLSFCNLIVIGSSFKDENLIKTVDYFAKTLRIQDSAVIVFSDKSAKEVLMTSSPLDNVSSFAIQKILLKDAGLDRDMIVTDIRSFSVGYYSRTSSCLLPVIKSISLKDLQSSDQISSSSSQSGGNNSSSGSGGEPTGDNLYDLTSTALFVKGKKVGEIDGDLTFTFNMLKTSVVESLLHLKDVDENHTAYLLSILRNTPKIELIPSQDGLKLKISLDLYCKISDVKSVDTDSTYAKNLPLPKSVKAQAEKLVSNRINELISTQNQTKCDILGLDNLLYKYHYPKYKEYKNYVFDILDPEITVTVTAQK